MKLYKEHINTEARVNIYITCLHFNIESVTIKKGNYLKSA